MGGGGEFPRRIDRDVKRDGGIQGQERVLGTKKDWGGGRCGSLWHSGSRNLLRGGRVLDRRERCTLGGGEKGAFNGLVSESKGFLHESPEVKRWKPEHHVLRLLTGKRQGGFISRRVPEKERDLGGGAASRESNSRILRDGQKILQSTDENKGKDSEIK